MVSAHFLPAVVLPDQRFLHITLSPLIPVAERKWGTGTLPACDSFVDGESAVHQSIDSEVFGDARAAGRAV
jgi:hypothetical protein